MGISIEKHFRIYDDETGDYIEIRPDPDALGLVTISSVHGGTGKFTAQVTMNKKEAEALSNLMPEFLKINELISE